MDEWRVVALNVIFVASAPGTATSHKYFAACLQAQQQQQQRYLFGWHNKI